MDIKIVLCDMDGTLLTSESKLPSDFDSVFHQLVQKDIAFGIASGRTLPSLKIKFSDYYDDMVVVCENGGCVSYKGEILHIGNIEKRVWLQVVDKVRTMHECSLVLCGVENSYIEDTDERILMFAKEYYPTLKIVDNLEDVNEKIVKMSIRDYIDTETNTKVAFRNFSDELDFAASDKHWLDIMPKGSSKAKGIEVLCEKLNCTFDNVMAFGDHFNDYEMLNAVKYSYAMENAIDEIKEICNYSCESNDKQGVTKTLKEVFDLK